MSKEEANFYDLGGYPHATGKWNFKHRNLTLRQSESLGHEKPEGNFAELLRSNQWGKSKSSGACD